MAATATADRYLVTPLGVPLALPYSAHYPHEPQEAFLALDCEEALYGGAARGGKSDALLLAALQYIHIPGYAAIIFRRIAPDLFGADGMIDRSKEWLLPHLGERAWNGTHMTWTFPSGATLRFGHMQYEDDKFKFQGHAYNFCGFDELTHFTESQYRYLFSRLTRPADGPLSKVPIRMRAASNPGGPGHEWVKRRFIDKQVSDDDDLDTPEKARARVFIPSKVADNPSVDRDAYVRSLSHLEPEVRAQLLDGDWDARQPGDWYFDDGHLAAVAELGRDYERALAEGDLSFVSGGVVHLGIDWGESSSAVLLIPLELGGFLATREIHLSGSEPADSTRRMLGLNTFNLPWGRAFFDAAGVQSQRTFNATAERILGNVRPRAKSIPFGAQAPRTAATARRSWKGVGAMYLRRLTRRAGEGKGIGILAVSPRCPELMRQLKVLERSPEDPQGAWVKDDGQHGADALLAGTVTTGIRFRTTTDRKVAA